MGVFEIGRNTPESGWTSRGNETHQSIKTGERMNTHRKTAIVVGALFLLGLAGAFGTIVRPILDSPSYLVKIFENQNQVMAGALIQIVMAFACAGIAIGLYPILRKHNRSLALGAVGFRIIENVLQIVAALGLLSLLTLSQDFVKADALAASAIQTTGDLVLAVRYWVSLVLSQFGFVLGALMYYYIFYRSKLIPRWLSGWGIVGIILQLASVFLTMFFQIDPFSGSPTLLLSIPIGLQELTLAIWLIVKGFNPSAVISLSAKTATNELLSPAV
jgi:hypothetical protein